MLSLWFSVQQQTYEVELGIFTIWLLPFFRFPSYGFTHEKHNFKAKILKQNKKSSK